MDKGSSTLCVQFSAVEAQPIIFWVANIPTTVFPCGSSESRSVPIPWPLSPVEGVLQPPVAVSLVERYVTTSVRNAVRLLSIAVGRDAFLSKLHSNIWSKPLYAAVAQKLRWWTQYSRVVSSIPTPGMVRFCSLVNSIYPNLLQYARLKLSTNTVMSRTVSVTTL